MERVKILAFYVFLGHGELQFARAGWKWSASLRYHANSILFHVSLENAVLLAYGASFSIHVSATYSTDDNDDDVIAPSEIPPEGYQYILVVYW